MSAWIPWILFAAAFTVLPVVLRAVADEPDNALTQEQPGGGGDEGDGDGEGVALAAA